MFDIGISVLLLWYVCSRYWAESSMLLSIYSVQILLYWILLRELIWEKVWIFIVGEFLLLCTWFKFLICAVIVWFCCFSPLFTATLCIRVYNMLWDWRLIGINLLFDFVVVFLLIRHLTEKCEIVLKCCFYKSCRF